MARPKKTAVERREQVLGVRLTPAERDELARRAAVLGLSSGEFLRRAGFQYRMPRVRPEADAMQHLAAALIPIGVNLNQVTRAANAGRLLPTSVTALADRISGLLDEFYGSGHHQGGPQL